MTKLPFVATAAIGVVFAVTSTGHAQVAGFSDVPTGHWAAQSVQNLAQTGIVQGQPKGSAPKAGAYNGNKPVTRYELAVTLWRFVQYMERADKQQKSPENASAPIDGKTAVQNLIAGGYLPKNTVLAKNDKTVTANQLADLMTQVIARITEKKVPISPDSLHAPEHPEHAHEDK